MTRTYSPYGTSYDLGGGDSRAGTLARGALVFGAGALLAWALASRERREAMLRAGRTALDTGSRLASASAQRLPAVMPRRARGLAERVASRSAPALRELAAAASETLQRVGTRASATMDDVSTRARRSAAAWRGELPAAADRDDRDDRDAEHVRSAWRALLEHPAVAPRERRLRRTLQRARRRAADRHAGRWLVLGLAAVGAGVWGLQRYGVIERLRGAVKGAKAAGGAIEIERAIDIEAPMERVFEVWSRPELFPRFMANVEHIEPLGGARSHWAVKGPAGVAVEWDVVTELEPPRALRWHSEPGSTVDHRGRVTLSPQGSGTRATVWLSYRPPAGRLGAGISALLGADPAQELEQDLRRMKQFVEDGGAGDAQRSSSSASSAPQASGRPGGAAGASSAAGG